MMIPSARVRWEATTRKIYFDELPLLPARTGSSPPVSSAGAGSPWWTKIASCGCSGACKGGQEPEELEHDADVATAPDGELLSGHLVKVAAIHRDRAIGGLADAGDEVDDGGLAAPHGAVTATISPAVMARSPRRRARGDPTRPLRRENLLHPGQLDDGIARSGVARVLGPVPPGYLRTMTASSSSYVPPGLPGSQHTFRTGLRSGLMAWTSGTTSSVLNLQSKSSWRMAADLGGTVSSG